MPARHRPGTVPVTPVSTGAVAAVDPSAGMAARSLLTIGRWRRAVRLVLGAVAAIMAVQLLPYALWEGPAQLWTEIVLLAAVAAWFGLPLAARLTELRHMVREDELGRGTPAAAVLVSADAACRRFDEAVDRLPGADWVEPARRRLSEARWAAAVRARSMAGLDRSLADVRRRTGGEGGAEEQRLSEVRATERSAALELVAEMDSVAETARRVASLARGHSQDGPEWSEAERSTLEALRRHRLELQALGSAWEEMADSGQGDETRA